MAAMTTTTASDLAAAFDTALERYQPVPGMVEQLKLACGFLPEQPVAGQSPVVAFHLDPGAELFIAHVVTPTRFVRHERTAEGKTFTVVVPLARISRVATLTADGTVEVTIELDADAAVAITEGRTLNAPTQDPAAPSGAVEGVTRTETRTTRANYRLVGDDAAVFASRLTSRL
jgi:hypothetical protein